MTVSNKPGEKIVAEYGMKLFGTFQIYSNGRTNLEIVDEDIAARPMGVYAWLIDDEIVRIGSSKAPMLKRVKSHSRWIELRLLGQCKVTDKNKLAKQIEEAGRWRTALKDNNVAYVWGRSGTLIQTQIGEFNSYLAEESALLGRHLPKFNNSFHR